MVRAGGARGTLVGHQYQVAAVKADSRSVLHGNVASGLGGNAADARGR